MDKVKLAYKEKLAETYGEPDTLDELFDITRQAIEDQSDISPYVHGFAWKLSYNNMVSNSHANPIDGVQNWQGKNGVPLGYPGFTGRVWIRVAQDRARGFVSDLFSKTLTYPGTGGFGTYDGPWKHIALAMREAVQKKLLPKSKRESIYSYSWDYRFFASDFPLIIDNWVKENLFTVIKTNNPDIKILHYKVWNHPDIEEADKKLLEDLEFEKDRMEILIDEVTVYD